MKNRITVKSCINCKISVDENVKVCPFAFTHRGMCDGLQTCDHFDPIDPCDYVLASDDDYSIVEVIGDVEKVSSRNIDRVTVTHTVGRISESVDIYFGENKK